MNINTVQENLSPVPCPVDRIPDNAIPEAVASKNGDARWEADAAGLTGSKSAIGNPYQKRAGRELHEESENSGHRPAWYETFADVANRLPKFMEEAKNTKRRHSALDFRSPAEFETNSHSRLA